MSSAYNENSSKKIFSNTIEKLMYGFGDEKGSKPESVALMEDIILDYIYDFCEDIVNIPGNEKEKLI